MGPIVAGSIVYWTNFGTLNALIFLSNIAYAPVLYILRNFYSFKPLENEELTSFAHQPLQNEPENDNFLRSIANNNYSTSGTFDSSPNHWSQKMPSPMSMTKENQYPQMNTAGQPGAVHFQSKSRNLLDYDEY